MKASFLVTLAVSLGLAVLQAAPPAESGTRPPLVQLDKIVGNPNNRPDKNGLGAVGYTFHLSRRITNAQYTLFLNTVDPNGTNNLGLYTPKMESRGEIEYLADAPSGKHYVARKDTRNNPVRFVGWNGAARYANWVSNGARSDSSTDTGAYNLAGNPNTVVPRNPDARYWIPNLNELYKAAFYGDGKYRKEPQLNTKGELAVVPTDLPPVAENIEEEKLAVKPAPIGEKVEGIGDDDDGFRLAWKPEPRPVAEAEEVPEDVGEGADVVTPVYFPYPPFLNFGPLNNVINPPADEGGDLPPAS